MPTKPGLELGPFGEEHPQSSFGGPKGPAPQTKYGAYLAELKAAVIKIDELSSLRSLEDNDVTRDSIPQLREALIGYEVGYGQELDWVRPNQPPTEKPEWFDQIPASARTLRALARKIAVSAAELQAETGDDCGTKELAAALRQVAAWKRKPPWQRQPSGKLPSPETRLMSELADALAPIKPEARTWEIIARVVGEHCGLSLGPENVRSRVGKFRSRVARGA